MFVWGKGGGDKCLKKGKKGGGGAFFPVQKRKDVFRLKTIKSGERDWKKSFIGKLKGGGGKVCRGKKQKSSRLQFFQMGGKKGKGREPETALLLKPTGGEDGVL